MKMHALVSDQGTAAIEAALCENCFKEEANKKYAREMASQSDDVNPEGNFVDCSENDALKCCVCDEGSPTSTESDLLV